MGQSLLLGLNAHYKKGHVFFLNGAEAEAHREEQMHAWLTAGAGLPPCVWSPR